MIEKYIEHENPFAKNGKEVFKIERETKTRYVVRYNEKAIGYFKKLNPEDEKDGALVHPIPNDSWNRGYFLRIKEV